MKGIQFIKKLIIISLVIGVTISLLSLFEFFAKLQQVSWLCLAFFFFTTIFVHYIAIAGIQNKSNARFIIHVFGSLMGKFILCVLSILAYYKLASPGDLYFIIPFFIMYVIFTTFETYILAKLTRMGLTKPNSKS